MSDAAGGSDRSAPRTTSGGSQSPDATVRDPHPALRDSGAPPGIDAEPASTGEARVPPPALANWERYRLIERLGAGGMGEVWKATDPRLGRFVALKLLRSDDPDMMRRFLREAQAQARIEHPRVCPIYESGEVAGRPYIVMQFVDGGTLRDVAGELSLEQKVRLIAEAADGLHAAHRTGLIHRDVKPSNIMAERHADGVLRALVVDFGIAREAAAPGLTRTGLLVGTPQYMAPEQALARDADIDRRTDVYGLGATMYELLSGHPPHDGGSSIEVVLQVINEETQPLRVRSPAVPVDLESVVMKCLEGDRDRRYDSARALAEDLRRFLDGDPVLARRTTAVQRLWKRARKRKGLVAAGVAAVLALAVLGGVAIRARATAAERARLAQRFGGEVAEMQWMLRSAVQLPLHDIRPDRERVRERMRAIESEMARLGPVAAGPGLFALGRAHFELGEIEEARTRLEAAWAASDREPELAVALGRTLGRLYQRAANDVELIPDRRARAARLADLDRTFRQPALDYLARASALPGSANRGGAGLAGAELALYREERTSAVAQARLALAAEPWLYEAALLEGDAHRANWREASDKSDWAVADVERDAALAAYRRASAIGASSPQAYLSLCEMALREISSQFNFRGGATLDRVRPIRDAGIDDCEKALSADPDFAAAWTAKGELLSRWADMVLSREGDALPDIDQGEAAIRRATELEPGFAAGWGSLGSILGVRATHERRRGLDPNGSIDRSIAAFERAIALEPRYVFALTGLGIAHIERAYDQFYSGKDPRQSFGLAVAQVEKAMAIDPEDISPLINLGNARTLTGAWEAEHGLDARASLDAGAAAFEKASALNPKLGVPVNGLATAKFQSAHQTLQLGEDPREGLAIADRTFGRSLELAPNEAYTLFNRAQVYGDFGEYERRSGRDPSAWVEKGVADFTKGLDLVRNEASAYVDCGLVHLVAARYLADVGRDPAQPLAEIHRLLTRALSLDPTKSSAHRLRGEAALVEARAILNRAARSQVGASGAAGALDRAAAALARTIELNALDAEAHAALAEVELLRAKGGEAAAKARGEAAAAKSLELFPRFARARAAGEALAALKQ